MQKAGFLKARLNLLYNLNLKPIQVQINLCMLKYDQNFQHIHVYTKKPLTIRPKLTARYYFLDGISTRNFVS